MSPFRFFKRTASAPTARERLQVLLAHERVSDGKPDLVAVLREEILAVIGKHIELDYDKVNIRIDRAQHVSILEIDVEIPVSIEARAA